MAPKLNKKNRKAVSRCLDALADLRDIDPDYAEQFIRELSWMFIDPEGFISAHDPADRDDARALLSERRSGR